MYGEGPAVLGSTTVAATTYAVTTLPNTGNSVLIQIAIAVAAGMLVWGVVYSRRMNRKNAA